MTDQFPMGKDGPKYIRIETMDCKPMVTFTYDRKVIIAGDIYEAAKMFWEVMREQLPPSWTMEVEP